MDTADSSVSYSVFGGTVQRSAGAAAIQGGNSFAHITGISRLIETAIVSDRLNSTMEDVKTLPQFSHNQSSNEVSCYWVNEDGSRPETYIGLNGQEG